MITRMVVYVEKKKNLDEVVAGLKAVGLPTVRTMKERSGQFVVVGYYDTDFDGRKKFPKERMEDYCVEIWSRIDEKSRIVLEHYSDDDSTEFGEAEHFNWESD